jgi:hypothetical protein
MQDFRKIKAWQRAHAMAIAIRKMIYVYRRKMLASKRESR